MILIKAGELTRNYGSENSHPHSMVRGETFQEDDAVNCLIDYFGQKFDVDDINEFQENLIDFKEWQKKDIIYLDFEEERDDLKKVATDLEQKIEAYKNILKQYDIKEEI